MIEKSQDLYFVDDPGQENNTTPVEEVVNTRPIRKASRRVGQLLKVCADLENEEDPKFWSQNEKDPDFQPEFQPEPEKPIVLRSASIALTDQSKTESDSESVKLPIKSYCMLYSESNHRYNLKLFMETSNYFQDPRWDVSRGLGTTESHIHYKF